MASEVANSKDSLAWYEKDLSDFDLTDSESLASEEAEQQKKGLMTGCAIVLSGSISTEDMTLILIT